MNNENTLSYEQALQYLFETFAIDICDAADLYILKRTDTQQLGHKRAAAMDWQDWVLYEAQLFMRPMPGDEELKAYRIEWLEHNTVQGSIISETKSTGWLTRDECLAHPALNYSDARVIERGLGEVGGEA